MDYLINFILSVVGSLFVVDLVARHKAWCKRIINAAVQRLPDEQQQMRREEWLAALYDEDTVIRSFMHAIGCWWGAPAVGAVLRRPETAAQTRKSLKDRNTELRDDLAALRQRLDMLARFFAEEPELRPALRKLLLAFMATGSFVVPVFYLLGKLFG